MNKKKKFTISDSAKVVIPCTYCNPKKYLKFSFSFITFENDCSNQLDKAKMFERMKWLSQSPINEMMYKIGKDKSKWFEQIPLEKVRKAVPDEFRKLFASETSECYDVIRVYPSGTPNGTANPRIIGMIKHSVFYIFFLDWKGELYKHGH